MWDEACEIAIATYKAHIPGEFKHMIHNAKEFDIHNLENALYGTRVVPNQTH